MADRWEDPGVIHVHRSNNNRRLYTTLLLSKQEFLLSAIIITDYNLFVPVQTRSNATVTWPG